MTEGSLWLSSEARYPGRPYVAEAESLEVPPLASDASALLEQVACLLVLAQLGEEEPLKGVRERIGAAEGNAGSHARIAIRQLDRPIANVHAIAVFTGAVERIGGRSDGHRQSGVAGLLRERERLADQRREPMHVAVAQPPDRPIDREQDRARAEVPGLLADPVCLLEQRFRLL